MLAYLNLKHFNLAFARINSMNKIVSIALLSILITAGCKSSQTAQVNKELPAFDTQGHRGARGLMPENTIPAMRKALDLGMTTIEMDCHITKDKKVVVTHDPHINPLYARKPDGSDLAKEEARKYVIYEMAYADVQKFDIGSKYYDLFPQQQKVQSYIPLLEELIDSVQIYVKTKGIPQVFYNIETKSGEKNDNKLHPEPVAFIELLVEVIERKKITPWVVIQSFDPRTLQVLHQKYPHIKTSLLVSNMNTLEDNLEKLGFIPTVYSPNTKLVTAELVKACHTRQMKVIPWTANTTEEITALKKLGVDGIISDYPNLLNQ